MKQPTTSFSAYLAKNAKFFKFFGITLVVFVGTMLALSSYHQRQAAKQQKKAEAEIRSYSLQWEMKDEKILINQALIEDYKQKILQLEATNSTLRTEQKELANQAKQARFEYVQTYGCEGMENVSFCSSTGEQQDVQKIPFRTNSQGGAKPLPDVQPNLSDFVSHYGLNPQDFIDAGEQYNILPEAIACIAWADSDMGQALKSKNNIGNVGNNDRGYTRDFSSMREGIFAIAQTLNNKYLGDKQTIDQLSGQGKGYVYATSPENWDVNVSNCMNRLDKKLG